MYVLRFWGAVKSSVMASPCKLSVDAVPKTSPYEYMNIGLNAKGLNKKLQQCCGRLREKANFSSFLPFCLFPLLIIPFSPFSFPLRS